MSELQILDITGYTRYIGSKSYFWADVSSISSNISHYFNWNYESMVLISFSTGLHKIDLVRTQNFLKNSTFLTPWYAQLRREE